MSLPTIWVDRIFDKLTMTYGQQFLRRWQDIDLNAVKSDWAHELSGFADHPKAIAWALQNIPTDKPPTVLEFRAIARKAPADDAPRLDAPKADPERVAAELQKLTPLRKAHRAHVDGKEWARRLIANHEAGIRSASPLPLKMARDAIAERTITRSEA